MQHFGEDLGWGFKSKTFPWGVVVSGDEIVEAFGWQGGEVGLARNEAAHAADGILDAALLPGGIGVAEVDLDGEPV